MADAEKCNRLLQITYGLPSAPISKPAGDETRPVKINAANHSRRWTFLATSFWLPSLSSLVRGRFFVGLCPTSPAMRPGVGDSGVVARQKLARPPCFCFVCAPCCPGPPSGDF